MTFGIPRMQTIMDNLWDAKCAAALEGAHQKMVQFVCKGMEEIDKRRYTAISQLNYLNSIRRATQGCELYKFKPLEVVMVINDPVNTLVGYLGYIDKVYHDDSYIVCIEVTDGVAQFWLHASQLRRCSDKLQTG